MKDLLEKDATILVSKKEGKPIEGLYSLKGLSGLSYHELPEDEIVVLSMLPSLAEVLEQKRILQIHQEQDHLVGYIGSIKTEGGYCEKQYLEVIIEAKARDYNSLLIELELESKKEYLTVKTDAVEYKKLYKGDKRYE